MLPAIQPIYGDTGKASKIVGGTAAVSGVLRSFYDILENICKKGHDLQVFKFIIKLLFA